jgi:FkbM family methyltransferase
MARPTASDLRRKLRPGALRRVEARFRLRVVRPLQRDGLADLVHVLPASSVRTVIDVGVHAGSLSADYLEAFPAARVIGVEADSRSTGPLRTRFADEPRFELVEAAASDVDGERVTFYATPASTTSSLLAPIDDETRAKSVAVEVHTVTIDRLCADRDIETVDLLKVDVEGAELEVLRGAERLLRSSAIRAIYAEARFVRETEDGVLLHELASFLAPFGYRLHNIYDQVESAARGTIYANALFLGPDEEQALARRTNERVFVQRLIRTTGRPAR